MIKVVIERRCKQGKESELELLLRSLRGRAMQQDGSWSWETLRSADDSTRWLVIASWTYSDEWETWRDSPERQEIADQIQGLLVEPVKETVYEFTG